MRIWLVWWAHKGGRGYFPILQNCLGCPCDEKCPAGCIGCNNDICFQNFGALLVLDDVGHGIDPNKQLFWLLDRDANEIDGLNFQYGEGTDVSAACATSFKGEMYLFGGYFIKDQVSFRRNSPRILSDDFR